MKCYDVLKISGQDGDTSLHYIALGERNDDEDRYSQVFYTEDLKTVISRNLGGAIRNDTSIQSL